jgi:hypothetical protein
MAATAAAQTRRPAETRSVPVDLVCGPSAALTQPAQALRVMGGVERTRVMFGTGEIVVINAGSAQGIRTGQHYYVRRVIEDQFTASTGETPPRSIHTAGWITVTHTDPERSLATISEACDGVVEGDYLEPLVLPADFAPTAGQPDFAHPGLVVLGDDRRQLGAAMSLMVIDRGSDHGVRPGQQITIFRRVPDETGPIVELGSGIVVSTKPETSLMRIQKSREAIQVGDKVALHR